MKQLFKILCENDNGVQTCSAHSLSGVEWFLVFTCAAILIAQLPNLNSIATVSLVGAQSDFAKATLYVTS
ncbi:lysine/histidine transporter 8-like protein [Trifolium pratense]|uniref:Lysine/histidine transporter 8-like protein n=1 Tax=Trifolium pratense TaxID=57577 RepID=A0A2K3M8Y7_TRIPR|nr:lysine/histidine transporter 8-like protein [Trifolium pratense]